MQIAISLQENNGLDSAVSPIFGRCPYFMLYDTETGTFQIKKNSAKSAAGGAGVQAAQMVVNEGAQAVISGNLGPKAHSVLASAQIKIFQCESGNAKTALEQFQQQALSSLSGPSAPMHSG